GTAIRDAVAASERAVRPAMAVSGCTGIAVWNAVAASQRPRADAAPSGRKQDCVTGDRPGGGAFWKHGRCSDDVPTGPAEAGRCRRFPRAPAVGRPESDDAAGA